MAFKTFREDPRRARHEAATAARKIIKPEPKVQPKAEPKVQVVPEFDPKPKIAKKVEKSDVI